MPKRRSFLVGLLLLLVLLSSCCCVAQVFDDCSVETYYAPSIVDPSSSPNLQALLQLLTDTHRSILRANDDDIYPALVDLFPGNDTDSVQLLFRNESIPAVPYGSINTWTRANLFWSGALEEEAFDTDVFLNYPVDATVWLQVDDLLYGNCLDEGCSLVSETQRTYTNGVVLEPPAGRRGEIARSLFYAALRYAQEGLTLSDCGPFANSTTFGFLSALLEWHTQEPVSDRERARNDRACAYWQGNRNVFVDFPEYVPRFFGVPASLVNGVYSECPAPATTLVPSESPTAAGPEIVTFPDDGIDYEGCFRDLVASDRNGDGVIKVNEFLTFIQTYGKRICHTTDSLTLEQRAAFSALACRCQTIKGNAQDCCLYDNAQIETAGALDTGRTKEQQFYLTSVCRVTDNTIYEPRGCTVETINPGSPPPFVFQTPPRASSAPSLEPTAVPMASTTNPTTQPTLSPTLATITTVNQIVGQNETLVDTSDAFVYSCFLPLLLTTVMHVLGKCSVLN